MGGLFEEFRVPLMKMRLLLLFITFFLPFIGYCADALPAIAVFTESIGIAAPGTDSGPHFLTAVWSDGRIVWSRDQQSGGAPYLIARIEQAHVRKLLKRFDERGVFKKSGIRRSWFGPDSTYQVIWLSSGSRNVRFETWHELFERNPKLVVINGSVGSLNGRTREEVIRSDAKEFQEFRRVWGDLRTAISALIPAAGEPYSGEMTFNFPR